MHSVYHFYLVNQPNFVFIIFKISCSCALYSLHLECNLYPHLVIKIIIYILFRRYILISMIPILTNTNNTIKFTSRYSLITSPSTAIPERLPSKNIWEILSHIFLYRFIASAIITIIILSDYPVCQDTLSLWTAASKLNSSHFLYKRICTEIIPVIFLHQTKCLITWHHNIKYDILIVHQKDISLCWLAALTHAIWSASLSGSDSFSSNCFSSSNKAIFQYIFINLLFLFTIKTDISSANRSISHCFIHPLIISHRKIYNFINTDWTLPSPYSVLQS